MPEIVMDTGRDTVLLVGGGSLCAAAVPLLRAAGLVPAGVIHGPRCDFAAEAGVPPLGRDADLARLRRDFSRAVVTAPHKQAARLRRLLHEALRAGARLEAGCRLGDHVHVGEGSHLGAGVIVEEGAHLGREVRVEAGLRLEKNIFVPDSVHLTRQTLPLYVAGGAREDRA